MCCDGNDATASGKKQRKSHVQIANRGEANRGHKSYGWAMSTMWGFLGCFQVTGNTHDAHRTGRSRVTSLRQDRAIPRNHQRGSFGHTTEMARTTIGSHGTAISGQTVRHRLREGLLLCCRPSKRTILTARDRHQLLVWAQHHLKWTWHQ